MDSASAEENETLPAWQELLVLSATAPGQGCPRPGVRNGRRVVRLHTETGYQAVNILEQPSAVMHWSWWTNTPLSCPTQAPRGPQWLTAAT